MKKSLGILIVVVSAMFYLNIGWYFGTYSYNNMTYTEFSKQEPIASILSGGWHFFSHPNTPQEVRHSLSEEQVAWSILWLPFIIFSLITWVLYAIWNSLIFIFGMIFLGGLVDLITFRGLIYVTIVFLTLVTLTKRSRNK